MKYFFSVVFGGLVIFLLVVVGASSVRFLWNSHLFGFSSSKSIITKPLSTDPDKGGSFSSVSSASAGDVTTRFSAAQEEDTSTAGAQGFPKVVSSKITAAAYSVFRISDGKEVLSHDSDYLLPIASLTKLVTAVVARQLIAPSAHITLSRDIMATYGNTADFKVGETFTASDLLYPLLMVSSNDAAEAYAQFYGRRDFISAMNAFTQSIGAYDTYFADPSGLSSYNRSSARDVAIIIQWIVKNDPNILSILELKSETVRTHTWVNPAHFLSWSSYVGGKNGYTPEAGLTSVSLFELGKVKELYAVVVLGSTARDEDVFSLLQKVE